MTFTIISAITLITTYAICKAAGDADKVLEHPERVWLEK
jgi:hypothetical protein